MDRRRDRRIRVPDPRSVAPAARSPAPTLREVAERWKATRVDVAESTRVLHRVALERVLPILGEREVDYAHPGRRCRPRRDPARPKAESGRRSERASASSRASSTSPAIDPNPARDRVHVRLPREDRTNSSRRPPTRSRPCVALLEPDYRFRCCGSTGRAPVSARSTRLCVSDYDEPRRRVRLRADVTKTRRALWVDLPDVLADALEATLGSRPDARLFAGIDLGRAPDSDRPRVFGRRDPAWSPHDLRHRRISLLHRQGRRGRRSARSSASARSASRPTPTPTSYSTTANSTTGACSASSA